MRFVITTTDLLLFLLEGVALRYKWPSPSGPRDRWIARPQFRVLKNMECFMSLRRWCLDKAGMLLFR